MCDILMALFNASIKNKKFYINIPKRTIRIGKKFIVKDGIVSDGYEINMQDKSLADILDEIEYFHENKYVVSRPSRVSTRKNIFAPKELKEMTQSEYLNGLNREMCRAILEGTILCRILDGSLYWDDDIMGGTMYWQSKKNPDLVLFKDFLNL